MLLEGMAAKWRPIFSNNNKWLEYFCNNNQLIDKINSLSKLYILLCS